MTDRTRLHSFNDPIVKIEVEVGVNGRRTWHLHRAPLLDQSKDFSNRLQNGVDTILLGDTSPETVNTFSHWLYSRSLDVAELRLDTPYEEGERRDQASSADKDGGDEAAAEWQEVCDGELYFFDPRRGGGGRTAPSPVHWTFLTRREQRGQDIDSTSSRASSESATLVGGSSPSHYSIDGDSDSDDDTPAAVEEATAAALPHPFDRVTVRLLDLHTFAQKYAIPALERDVLALLQRHREDHRAQRPRPSIEVLAYACYNNHFYADDDPLWRWLAADFARTEMGSPGAIGAMCERLPLRFCQTAFKAKMAADAAALETMAADMVAVRASCDAFEFAVETRNRELHDLRAWSRAQGEDLAELQSQSAADAEKLANLQSQAAADAEEREVLQAKAKEAGEARDRYLIGLNLAIHENKDLEAHIQTQNAQARELKAQAAADADALNRLKAQAAEAEKAHDTLLQENCHVIDERSDLEARLQTQAQQVVELEAQKAADAAAVDQLRAGRMADGERIAGFQTQLAEAHEEISRFKNLVDGCGKERARLEARNSSLFEQKLELERRIERDADEFEDIRMQAGMDSEELARLRALFSGDETDEWEE